MIKVISISVLIFLMTGCATYSKPVLVDVDFNQEGRHRLLPYDDLQYMSCDYESEYSKNIKKSNLLKPDSEASSAFTLSEKKSKVAKNYYVYALMSNNVYRDNNEKPNFKLPNWKGIIRKSSDSGLAFEEYQRESQSGQLEEIVIAFKGTDFSELNDWKENFSISEPRQYREARDYIEEVLSRPNVTREVKVTVTGHSLGGGIALNMSLLYPGVDAVTFNQSPRGFYNLDASFENSRVLIYEAGEMLAFVRVPWYFKLNDFSETYFNYLDFKFWATPAINEHSMYLFSRGLLLTAIKVGDSEAELIFKENFGEIDLDQAFDVSWAKKSEQDKQYCNNIFMSAGNHNKTLQRTSR